MNKATTIQNLLSTLKEGEEVECTNAVTSHFIVGNLYKVVHTLDGKIGITSENDDIPVLTSTSLFKKVEKMKNPVTTETIYKINAGRYGNVIVLNTDYGFTINVVETEINPNGHTVLNEIIYTLSKIRDALEHNSNKAR